MYIYITYTTIYIYIYTCIHTHACICIFVAFRTQESGEIRGSAGGSVRGYPKKEGWRGALLTIGNLRAISPLKIPSLDTDLYTVLRTL